MWRKYKYIKNWILQRKVKMKAELKNGYWYVGTNRWNADTYTQDQVEMYAEGMINCRNCMNCKYCTNCTNCWYCTDCIDCTDCTNCANCTNCMDCRGCTDCTNCTDCTDCKDCTDFKSNPQHIASPKMGSRNAQTTYYFTDNHEQIVCGCFKGTLQEFENRINAVHGEDRHGQDYMKWIKTVKDYKEAIK